MYIVYIDQIITKKKLEIKIASLAIIFVPLIVFKCKILL